jgi:flagellar hook-basal body complex protein FliE
VETKLHIPKAMRQEVANFSQGVRKLTMNEIDIKALTGIADTNAASEWQKHDVDPADIQSAMIALEKADSSFQTMTQVRNKILAAYQEVMAIQV